MKKQFLLVLGMVSGLFPSKKLDGKNKTELSKAELDQIDAESGQEGLGEAFMTYYNDEYVNEKAQTSSSYAQFMQEFNAANDGVEGSADESEEGSEEEGADEVPEADAKTSAQQLAAVMKIAKAQGKTISQMSADMAKLKTDPEEDVPEAVIVLNPNAQSTVKHSTSHLFASNNSWDALDRPWNKNAASVKPNQINGVTNWGDKINIDKLNSDLGAYSRRNPSEIMDLLMDGYDIPAHWTVVSNIQDQFAFASIVSGQITQAFKKAYLPKNDQRFVPVINKIYDKQIDGNWSASELKSIEKSWLNMFFNEGSTPYKDSFALYLIQKLLNQARKEDKISIFKGVYSDPELQPEVAGDFLNSMSGFLKLVDQHRGVDYQPFNVSKLTPQNAYTELTTICKEQLPIDIRNTPLKIGVGNDLHRWYIDGRESAKGLIQDYAKQTSHIEDMPNIEFVKHPQLEGSGFFYITTEDNIGLMVDRPGEESLITIEKALRAINFFADWKLGVFFKAFGANIDPDATVTFEDQIFFSNNAPLLTEVYVPIAADDLTPSVAEHNALRIGSNNTGTRSISNIDDAVTGQYVYLYGDSDANVSTVVSNANLKLDGGNFILSKGNRLILLKQADGTFLEYSRTVASEVSSTEKIVLDANATTADALEGTHFITSANTAATVITTIEDAQAEELYTIEGGSDADSSTIANGGNFLLTEAFTASAGATLTVVFNGVKFVEVERG